MDLLALFTTLRRHKMLVLVVLLLTAAADAYIAFGIPPQYESKAQYVLINPPSPPTDSQIARDPKLASVNTNNPFLRLPNPSVVVDVVAQRVSGDNVRRELIAHGADENYLVASTNAIGSGTVIDITGTGTSATQATRTLELVSERMKAELYEMQKVDGADDEYLIQALLINPPTDPLRKVTSTIRSLIGVTAAGAVLLFALLSITEAMRVRRVQPISPAAPPRAPAPPQPQPARPMPPMPPNPPARSNENDLTMLLPKRTEEEIARARGQRRRN